MPTHTQISETPVEIANMSRGNDGFYSEHPVPQLPHSAYPASQHTPWLGNTPWHDWRMTTQQDYPTYRVDGSLRNQFQSPIGNNSPFTIPTQTESLRNSPQFTPTVQSEAVPQTVPQRSTDQWPSKGQPGSIQDSLTEDCEEQVRRSHRRSITREGTKVLKDWLKAHLSNPYPSKGEKIMLAIFAKMSVNQVSTWFANARRRLKKENQVTWMSGNRSPQKNLRQTNESLRGEIMPSESHNQQALGNWEPGNPTESQIPMMGSCDWLWHSQNGTQIFSHQNHPLNVYSSSSNHV